MQGVAHVGFAAAASYVCHVGLPCIYYPTPLRPTVVKQRHHASQNPHVSLWNAAAANDMFRRSTAILLLWPPNKPKNGLVDARWRPNRLLLLQSNECASM